MSLKSFHIFFILVAAVFCAAMAAWAFLGSSEDVLGASARGFGFGSAACCAVLAAYGVWFALKKYRSLAA